MLMILIGVRGEGEPYAEAEHYCVSVVVGEGAKTVEFFLTCCVPKREFDVGVIDEDVCRP